MKLTLLPHQEKVVEFAKANRYFICSVSMGGGKTSITLYLQDMWKARMLVLCPSYLIPNWKIEIEKWYGDTKQVTVVKNADDVYPLWDTDICLASYEATEHYEKLFEWASLVIFEEGHYLKNMDAKRTINCHRLLWENSSKRMIILTGTPIVNRVIEFYSLMALCFYNPFLKTREFLERFPEAISFAEKFSFKLESRIKIFSPKLKRMIDMPVIKWYGLQNKDELKTWLKGIYIRVNSKEFMKSGGHVYKDSHCEYSSSDKKSAALLEAFSQFIEEKSSINPTIKVEAAMQTVPFTVKYCKDLSEQVGKVVVYSDHVEPCEAIAKGLGVSPISGKLSPEERQEIAQKFIKGDQMFLVATFGSFSTGVDGLQVASHMVWNDSSWIPGVLKQARHRIDRIGQTTQCTIHRIMGTKQSEKIYDAIAEKEIVINEVTD